MSGKRGTGWRGGDRSEYLAQFALSRVAFLRPVPRQEDFGVVDLVCVLARQEGSRIYPEGAINVQVKSDTKDVVFDEDAAKWLSEHMNNPLFICVIDKKADEISVYACSRILRALFLRSAPKSITLKLGAAAGEHTILDDANGTMQIYAGEPIFRQALAEVEQDGTCLHRVLSTWMRLDSAALAQRAVGGVTATTFCEWKTNEVPSAASVEYFFGPNYGLAEAGIAPILTALAHNYRHAKDATKLDALRPFLSVLRPLLDAHGIDFADGKLKVE